MAHSDRSDGPASPFLAPAPKAANIDRYLIRRRILDALLERADKLHGTLLDVGCGESPYRDLLTSNRFTITRYIGLDQRCNPIHDNSPELYWEEGSIPLGDASVDSALCTEVLEHCPQPAEVLSEIHRVLKPNGHLFFTTPFLWPLHELPFDEYRYTPFALERLLRKAGFAEPDIRPMGGWDASLAQMIGLWARRRPSGRWGRAFWSRALYPVYRVLIWSDTRKEWRFDAGIMFTGLFGTASKPGAMEGQE